MAVFLAIAVLIIMTGTSRMVEQQRTQIGTLNAIGMDRGKITRHYLSYSLVTSCAGSMCTVSMVQLPETLESCAV